MANSIESLIALYCHRVRAEQQLEKKRWNPNEGNLADQIDASLINASKDARFPEKLW